MRSPIMYWDEETGISQCVITSKNGTVHIGTATCSPEDQDMKNEMTGGEISYHRAQIAYLQYIKNNELRPALKALKIYWNTINKSKYYDANSYPV